MLTRSLEERTEAGRVKIVERALHWGHQGRKNSILGCPGHHTLRVFLYELLTNSYLLLSTHNEILRTPSPLCPRIEARALTACRVMAKVFEVCQRWDQAC